MIYICLQAVTKRANGSSGAILPWKGARTILSEPEHDIYKLDRVIAPGLSSPHMIDMNDVLVYRATTQKPPLCRSGTPIDVD